MFATLFAQSHTYLEMADLPVESLPTPDQHQPSFLAKQKDGSKPLGRCPKCPSYSFSSKAEKLRHCRIMHNITGSDTRTLDCTGSGRKNRWICSFETGVHKTCGLSFKYERESRLHKEATGYALNRTAAADAHRRGITARALVQQQQDEVGGDDEEGGEEDGV
jgi:hypothetical protein